MIWILGIGAFLIYLAVQGDTGGCGCKHDNDEDNEGPYT
jgi:hypothetical protein